MLVADDGDIAQFVAVLIKAWWLWCRVEVLAEPSGPRHHQQRLFWGESWGWLVEVYDWRFDWFP